MGEFMMTAWVCSFTRDSSAARSIWKLSVSAGTMTNLLPEDSMKGLYSGKKGAMAMTSLSSQARAVSAAMSAGAAPQVKKRFAGLICLPKRSVRFLATAARMLSSPGPLV